MIRVNVLTMKQKQEMMELRRRYSVDVTFQKDKSLQARIKALQILSSPISIVPSFRSSTFKQWALVEGILPTTMSMFSV